MTFEHFELVTGSHAPPSLTPGDALRALALGAAIPSEDVDALRRDPDGVIHVRIAARRAARLITPRPLPSRTGGRAALYLLRRPSDVPPPGHAAVLITTATGDLPRPADLAPLAAHLGLGAEDLDEGYVGADFLRLTLPLPAHRRLPASFDLPATATTPARTLTLTSLAKKP